MNPPREIIVCVWLEVTKPNPRYRMEIEIDDEKVTGAQSERVERDYDTATDALTSARHAVKEVTKERPAAMGRAVKS